MNKSNNSLAQRQLADEFGAKKPMMEIEKAYALIGMETVPGDTWLGPALLSLGCCNNYQCDVL